MQRNTAQKKAMEQVFLQHERPLSVDDILMYGREFVPTLNQATVYRNLKNLVEQGWLKRISHPTLGVLYERTEKGHHHHFHCRECKRAFELPGCAMKEEKAVPDGFIVEEHEIFLFGVCSSCNQDNEK